MNINLLILIFFIISIFSYFLQYFLSKNKNNLLHRIEYLEKNIKILNKISSRNKADINSHLNQPHMMPTE